MDRSSFPRYLVGSSEARKQRATCHGKGLPVKGRCYGSLALVFLPYQKSSKWTQGALQMGPAPPTPGLIKGPSCTQTSQRSRIDAESS